MENHGAQEKVLMSCGHLLRKTAQAVKEGRQLFLLFGIECSIKVT